MDKKYVVYQHVTPDGMYYFGQTNNIKRRWRNNGAGYKGTSLYPYIEQYGWDNIQHIVLFENQTRENALWIEDFLITTAQEDGVCINKNRSGFVSKEEGYTQEYYETNKEQILEQHKQYREQNKEQIREQKKQYYEENKDKIKQYREQNKEQIKQYYEQNKEQIREQSKRYYEENKDKIKQYREQNKEQIREQSKRYYEKNKDKIKEISKQYYEKNKDKKRAYNRQYYQRKKLEKQLKEVQTTLF